MRDLHTELGEQRYRTPLSSCAGPAMAARSPSDTGNEYDQVRQMVAAV